MHVPHGFRLAGVHCGLKTSSREDISLIVAAGPVVAAGVYTQNLICAAPVELCRARTTSSQIRAVITNSGNANACTGQQGKDDAIRMTELVAAACDVPAESVLVMSTGIIGKFMPMAKVEAGIASAASKLSNDEESLHAASRGITTTDKTPKIVSRQIQLNGETITITAMAKGAGMIGPRMATLLGVVLTDASLSESHASKLLKVCADASFNSISVEGHTSTNDTVLLLASGKVGGPLDGDELRTFSNVVEELCIQLAKMIPDDGEGATHLIEIEVSGCDSNCDAKVIAETIASSNLVKTAITGNDPNWGRIVSAAGYAGVHFDVSKVSLKINGHTVYQDGTPTNIDAATVSKSMAASRDCHIQLSVGGGQASAKFWTSDLTCDYVKFNSEYTT
ncbi:MAG: glutamate N-acetyltransferase/amino-acid N-acetyltransferase [Pirellulaceae bacterium]|jgi:glutamate N-acetyltransferase/amino-acid N-acetyltransferase